MAHFAIQFGKQKPGICYKERPSVYGICLGEHNKIAIVRIGSRDEHKYDLPGGGIEKDESEPEALIREFEEEAGIDVWPIRQLCRSGQFWINSEIPTNSLSCFYEVEITSQARPPLEPDHTLVWMAVDEAIKKVRHDSHAWAILAWERDRIRDAKL